MKNSKTTTDNLTKIAGLALISLSIGCASSMRVNHATEPGFALGDYHTYAIIEQAVGHEGADIHIERAIKEVMKNRGFAVSNAEPADLLVNFKVLIVGVAASQPTGGMAIGGAQMNGVGAEVAVAQNVAAEDRLDKLILIQLHEAKTMRVVWVGWAEASADKSSLAKSATKAASQILERVPERT